jgi:hypothetical protein
MTNIPSLEDEVLKFQRMNRPTSSAYRLAHAVRVNDAEPFDPALMLKSMEPTIDKHMADHIDAVKQITSQSRAQQQEE